FFICICFKLQTASGCNTPKPEIVGNDTVCENSVAFYNITPQLDPNKLKINISVSGNKAQILKKYTNQALIEFKSPGLVYIKVVYTDEFRCTDSVIKTIYVQPSGFRFSAGIDITVCQNDTVLIGKPPLFGFTYKWYDNFAFVDNHPFNVSTFLTQAQFKHITNKYISYFSVVATDTISGCSYVDTIFIKVLPRYRAQIQGEYGCLNNKDVYSYCTDSFPPNAYWVVDGGDFLSDYKSECVGVKWKRPGKNRLMLKYFTGSCADSAFIETGLSTIKTPFYAGPDVTVCNGDSVLLGAEPNPNCTYQWLDRRYLNFEQWYDRKSYIKIKARSSENNRTFRLSFLVIITDTLNGCRFYDTVNVFIKPRLKSNITAKTGCFTDIATFSIDTFPPNAYWVVQNGEIISAKNARSILVKWTQGGRNMVALKYNTNGCEDSGFVMVDIDSLTHFNITGADSVFENTYHTYSVKNISNSWNNWQVDGGKMTSETDSTITVFWENTNEKAYISNYKKNNSGCSSDTSRVKVYVKSQANLQLKNTFHIYPNPFYNKINIAALNDFDGEISVTLTDIPGRKIINKTAYMHHTKNTLFLDIQELQLLPGIYLISVDSKIGAITRKMLKL
ncbi:MAG: T9SS type A sorting domain-containing protein, partial [Pedobacter sp.]